MGAAGLVLVMSLLKGCACPLARNDTAGRSSHQGRCDGLCLAGADMVELGNYDSFYLEGRTFSAEEVLALTVRTRYVVSMPYDS